MQKHTQPLLIIVSLLFVFLLTAGCVSQTNSNANTSTGIPPGTTTGNTGNVSTSGTTKEFTITAKKFSFEPSTITVNNGDTVIIHATSTDVGHGFALPAFGVSQNLHPGQEVTFQFVANQTGTFPFFCNVFCGEDHSEMRGSLIVK